MKKVSIKVLAVMFFLAGGALLSAQVDYTTSQHSNTYTSTAGLFSDGLIDSVTNDAAGFAGADALVFAAYDTSAGSYKSTQIGAGAWIGSKVWTGLFWAGNSIASMDLLQTATTTETSSDGVTVDSTSSSDSSTLGGSSGNKYVNEARWALTFNKKIGFALFYDGSLKYTDKNIYNTAGGAVSSSTTGNSDSADSADGTASAVQYNTTENYEDNGSYYGADLLGMKLQWKAFYAQLDTVKFYTKGKRQSGSVTAVSTVNGSTLGASSGTNYTSSASYSNVVYSPSVNGRIGFDLPEFKGVNTNIELLEGFAYGIPSYTSSSTYTAVDVTSTGTTTTKTDYAVTYGQYYEITEKLTPRVNFSYKIGDSCVVKIRGDAALCFSENNNGADYTTVTTNTSTYTSADGTTTVKNVIAQEMLTDNTQNVDKTVFTITPAVSVGASCTLVPDRCKMNFGILMTPSVSTWTNTKTTNSNTTLENRTDETDSAGNTTCTASSSTVYGNGIPETNETSFTKATGDMVYFLDCAWVLSKNVDLDVIFIDKATSFSIITLLGSASFSVQCAVKF